MSESPGDNPGLFYFIVRKILYKVVEFGKNGIYIKNGGLCNETIYFFTSSSLVTYKFMDFPCFCRRKNDF
jgi:hypothetical protein